MTEIPEEVKRRMKDFSVGSMTLDNYVSDNDPNGSIGIALADEVHRVSADLRLEEDVGREEQRLRYAAFLKRARNVSNPFPKTMRKMLIDCFPGRFGKDGVQSIGEYGNGKLFGLYEAMKKESKRYSQRR